MCRLLGGVFQFFFVAAFFGAGPLLAQDESGDLPEEEQEITHRFNKSQFGEVAFEEEEKKDSYKTAQDQAIALFQELDRKIKALRQGSTVSGITASDEALNYLTGAYLYCVMKKGVCPMVLEALFEIDLINSKLQNGAQCPVLKRFWSLWAKNAMEERAKYLIQTGMLEAVADFNANLRPKYIRCEATVKNEIESGVAGAAFFKERYREGARPVVATSKMVTFLTLLKEKIPNVFVATGAQSLEALRQPAQRSTSSTSATVSRKRK